MSLWKYRLQLILLMLGVLGLVGCSSTELEERCFPMLVAVGEEEGRLDYGVAFPKESKIHVGIVTSQNFEDAKEKYENRLSKEADYSHLKMLVFEDDLLTQSKQFRTMLDVLAKSEEFPRNTYVCVVDDIEDLFELEQHVEQDLGTYLEEVLKLQEEKKERLLTLGDLLDEKENQSLVLYIPYFEIEDNYVQWNGYMNTSGKMWQESK